MQSPDRTPLSQKTADAIEQAIHDGRWRDKLPGHRKLSEMMGVSTRTIHAALAILTRKEVILPAERTKARRVNPVFHKQLEPSGASKTLLIIADTPLQELGLTARQIIEKLSSLFTNKRWTVHFEATQEMAKGHPGPTMQRLLSNFSEHHWLLIKPNLATVDWCTEHKLRVICLGGDRGKTQPPLVGTRLSDMLDGAIEHLANQGHQRICILKPPTTKEARSFLSDHCAEKMQQFNLAYHPSYNFPVIRRHSANALLSVLDTLFSHTPPTALITTDFAQLLTIYTFCQQKNLSIPEDVSIVATQESEYQSWLRPLPAHFSLPVNQYVKKIARWIEHYPEDEVAPIYLCSTFLKGDSTAAPSE